MACEAPVATALAAVTAIGTLSVAALSVRIRKEPPIEVPAGMQLVRFAVRADALDTDDPAHLWFCEAAGCAPILPAEIREMREGETWSPWPGDDGSTVVYVRALAPVTPYGEPTWIELERWKDARAVATTKGEKHWACANERTGDGIVGGPDVAVALSRLLSEGVAPALRAFAALGEACR